MLAEWCSHYLHSLPDYMPLAPQMRHVLFGQNPSSHYCLGPPAVLSTRSAFLLGKCTTVSNPTGTRKRALDHRASQHQPDPPNPGVPIGGVPAVGGTPNFSLHLPQVLTSWLYCLPPSHPVRKAWETGPAL